jgi:hypothetical protein
VKEAGEYAGAHVLSMVRAHYPLIDLKCLEAGYPKEVDPDKAEELRMTQLDLSVKIIGDITLCGGATPPVQGTPSIGQLGASSSLSQPAKPTVSTSQASTGPSSSARSMPESSRPEHDVRRSEQQAPRAPTNQ